MISSGSAVSSGEETKPFEQTTLGFPGGPFETGYTAANFDDSIKDSEKFAWLVGVFWTSKDASSGSRPGYGVVCTTVNQSNCANADDFVYNAPLKVCANATEQNCVESLSASLGGQKEVQAEFLSYSTPSYAFNFVGESKLGIPDGASPSLWRLPGISHQGGDVFMLNFSGIRENIGNDGDRSPTQLRGTITPISEKVGSFQLPVVNALSNDGTKANYFGIASQSTGDCFRAISESRCALAWPHPNGITYRITLRLAKSWKESNFMYGRLQDPSIVLAEDRDGNRTLTISAKPIRIPVIRGWKSNSSLSSELNEVLDLRWDNNRGGGTLVGKDDGSNKRSGYNWDPDYNKYNANSFNAYLLWLKEFQDKASGSKSVWLARTLRNDELGTDGKSGRCIFESKNFAGIITSNAGMYITGPPQFNEKTQSLDYKVASPHYDENGVENLGSYNLLLDSDVARCIYGFSNAPISGVISVVDSNGQSRVATTVVNERDGWLYLSANGFTYSAPTVQVKLTQAQTAPTVTPSTSPTPNITSTPVPSPSTTALSLPLSKGATSSGVISQRKSVICLKGTQRKKFIGKDTSKPSCPKGWKKA